MVKVDSQLVRIGSYLIEQDFLSCGWHKYAYDTDVYKYENHIIVRHGITLIEVRHCTKDVLESSLVFMGHCPSIIELKLLMKLLNLNKMETEEVRLKDEDILSLGWTRKYPDKEGFYIKKHALIRFSGSLIEIRDYNNHARELSTYYRGYCTNYAELAELMRLLRIKAKVSS